MTRAKVRADYILRRRLAILPRELRILTPPSGPPLEPLSVSGMNSGSGSALRRLSLRLEGALVLALVLVYLAVMLPSLTRFPPLNNDEGREGNLSWVASGLQPGAERMNAYRGFGTWGTGGLQGATTVALFRLFGLGLFQARLTSLLWGGLLLLVVYWLGRHYWGRAVGLAAMALLAVSDPFLLSTHTLRPDIQVVTLVLLALALVEHGLTSGRSWPPVVAGLLLGLSFDTHMNTLAFMPLVAAAPLVRYGWSAWRRPTIWLLAAGLGLAALYYIGVRILPDPSGDVAAMRYWIGVDKAPPLARDGGSGGLLAQARLELLRYAEYFGVSGQGIDEPTELALIVLGLAAAAIFFVLVVSMKSRYYMLLTYPIYVLLIARGFQQLAGRLRPPALARAGLAALVLLAVLWPLKFHDRAWDKYVRGVRYRAGQEYYLLTAQLEQLAGPDAKILAPPLFWYGLHDHPFTDIYVFERVRRQYGETADQFLASVRPDLVITDAKIATDKATERELHRALLERAPAELVVRHKNYGDLAIYRLRWP